MPDRSDHDVLARGVSQLRTSGDFAVAFGGLVDRDEVPLSEFAGVRSERLRGLTIEPTEGLGGRALVDRAPRYTADYQNTKWITLRYGAEVRSEGIVTLLAVPVVVGRRVRALLYAGHRDAVQIGNSWADRVSGIARRFAWELSVRDEVDRRVEVLKAEDSAGSSISPVERLQLRERFAELREIASGVDDASVRARIEAVSRDLVSLTPNPAVRLSNRELDVLAEVAMGRSNAEVGERLMLAESTVKKYLATAMQGLGARNRFDAVLKARITGLLP